MSAKRRSSNPVLGGSITALFIAFVILVYRMVTGSAPGPDLDPTAALPPITPGQPPVGEVVQVFFSDPDSPSASSYRGGPDQALADAIDAARLSVDIAAYDFDLWSLRDALLAAHRRGVGVRMVTDSDYLDNPEVNELREAGIPVLGDRREGLMHNKFVVIDRQDVWTGSMNFTVNGAYRNDNNLIWVRSARMAQNYTAEFDEMFIEDIFGTKGGPETPYPQLEIDGTRLEIYFSPDDGTAARLVELISSAQESVSFMAFSFTADDIASAMLARAANGVIVRGVFEESQVESNIGDEYLTLRNAGLDVRLDGNRANMHHKVIIIDDTIVITGSYNFSASAEDRNDENTLVIYSPQIAALFQNEFARVMAQTRP